MVHTARRSCGCVERGRAARAHRKGRVVVRGVVVRRWKLSITLNVQEVACKPKFGRDFKTILSEERERERERERQTDRQTDRTRERSSFWILAPTRERTEKER